MIDMTAKLDKELSIMRGTRTINAVGRVKRFDGQIVHASAFPAAVGHEPDPVLRKRREARR